VGWSFCFDVKNVKKGGKNMRIKKMERLTKGREMYVSRKRVGFFANGRFIHSLPAGDLKEKKIANPVDLF